MIGPLVLVAIVVGTSVAAALRRPILARLAVRSALRRPAETLLVVLGSLLGTAIITGSLIVGDTLDASVRASVPDQLGPIDLIVRTADDATGAAARDALASLDDPSVDGVLPIVVAEGAVATVAEGTPATGPGEVAGERRAAPGVQLLELDVSAGAAFGGDAAATGLQGAVTPAQGHVLLSRDLARELGVEPGAAVDLFAYSSTLRVTVDAILERRGVAGFTTAQSSMARNAVLAPGTLGELAGGAAGTAAPPQQQVLISAAGGVFDADAATDDAELAVARALTSVPATQVSAVKRDVLTGAEIAGDAFGELFLSIGSFAILAGVLLLVNIFVMLAEERKSELGMLRAVGLRRRDLVVLFTLEGFCYALAAATVGAVLGIGVGRVIVLVASGIFAGFELTLRFDAQAASIGTGFAAGLAISVVTVLVTSLRVARINIIRAIRDLPEPVVHRRRLASAVALAVGIVLFGALGANALAAGEPAPGLALPPLAALCAGLLAARALPRRPVLSATAAVVLAFALFADRVVDFEGGDIAVFIIQGVVLTASAVALLSLNQEIVGAVVRRVGGGGSLVARLGLAYPLARRFRTGMTLAMYSLVIFTLVFISVLSDVLGSATDDAIAAEAGGFDLLVTSAASAPVDESALAAVEGVERVAVLRSGFATFGVASRQDPIPSPLSGFDQAFLDGGAPPLAEWDREQHPTSDEAWRAVLADPRLVVIDAIFGRTGGGPPAPPAEVGDVVRITDPTSGRTVEREVAGRTQAGLALTGVLASDASVREALALAPPVRAYLTVADGADADDVAARIQGALVANGVEAESFVALVERASAANAQFFRLMQGYLALGLLVGIAGLGVIMVRAVRERRRQIGMLRSIGVQAATVQRAFLLESTLVALEGVVVGTALALVTAYQLITNADAVGDTGATFGVPWAQLAVILGVAVGASVLATAAPARQASRIRPAVALRLAD